MLEKFQNKYTIKSTRLKNHNYTQAGLYFVTICTRDKEYFFGEIKNGEMNLNDIGKIAHQFWQKIPQHFPFVNLDQFVVMPDHVHGIIEINKNPVETQFIASKTNITSKTINVSETNITAKTNITSKTINVSETNIDHEIQATIMRQGGISDQNAATCRDALKYRDAIAYREAIIYRDAITYRDALKCVSTENNKKQLGGVTGLKNPSLNLGSLSNIIKWYKGRCAFEIGKQFPIGFHWQSRFFDHIIRNDETLNKIREYINKNPARWKCDCNNNPENIWI
jgi:REP element-mobilizing transposase RayT